MPRLQPPPRPALLGPAWLGRHPRLVPWPYPQYGAARCGLARPLRDDHASAAGTAREAREARGSRGAVEEGRLLWVT